MSMSCSDGGSFKIGFAIPVFVVAADLIVYAVCSFDTVGGAGFGVFNKDIYYVAVCITLIGMGSVILGSVLLNGVHHSAPCASAGLCSEVAAGFRSFVMGKVFADMTESCVRLLAGMRFSAAVIAGGSLLGVFKAGCYLGYLIVCELVLKGGADGSPCIRNIAAGTFCGFGSVNFALCIVIELVVFLAEIVTEGGIRNIYCIGLSAPCASAGLLCVINAGCVLGLSIVCEAVSGRRNYFTLTLNQLMAATAVIVLHAVRFAGCRLGHLPLAVHFVMAELWNTINSLAAVTT